MIPQSALEKAEDRIAEREDKAIRVATQLLKADLISPRDIARVAEIIARNLT